MGRAWAPEPEHGARAIELEILAVLREINAKLASSGDSRSSVEEKTSTRGVDVTTKAYQGSPIIEAEGEAIASYFRTVNEVADRLQRGGA